MTEEAFFTRSEVMRVRTPEPSLAQCGTCGLHRGCETPFMKPSGQGRRRILIVGESPGREEDRSGEPFVGESGRLLRERIRREGVDSDRDCWFTNAVICRPPNNNTPDMAPIYCRPNLLRTIRELSPDVIIPLGNTAVTGLIGHIWTDRGKLGGISRWAGWQIPDRKFNAWICPTFHPAFLLYEAERKNNIPSLEFERHLRAALELEGRPWPDGPPDDRKRIEVITDPIEGADRLDAIRSGVVAFDFENNMLKPDHADGRIVCVSVSDGETSFTVPWHGPVKAAALAMLEDPRVGKIASNLQHEHRWVLAKTGIRVRRWVWDTMVQSHVLDPRGRISSIKFQAYVRLGVPPWNRHIQPMLEGRGGYGRNRIHEVSTNDLFQYCALDSLYEFGVAQIQSRELGVPLDGQEEVY